jgi:hypothetical protein
MTTFQRLFPTVSHCFPETVRERQRTTVSHCFPTPYVVRVGGKRSGALAEGQSEAPKRADCFPRFVAQCNHVRPSRRSAHRIDRPSTVIAMTAAQTFQQKWNPDEREAALTIYAQHGLARANRDTGIPRTTIRRWAARANFDPRTIAENAKANSEAAREAALARCEDLRLELREEFLLVAAESLERARQPYVEFVGVKAEQVEYPVPPAGALFNLVKSAATALDKYRLEVGEATDRTELVGVPVDEARRELATVIDLELARRAS